MRAKREKGRSARARSDRPPTAPARRVLVLNWRDPWHPEGGGSELYVHQVAARLVAEGREVSWFTAAYPGSKRHEHRDGIRFIRRGGRLTVYAWAAWYLLTGRFGTLDAVLEVQNGMPFLASWWTRARVAVLVHHVHREQWSVVGPALAPIGWLMESRVGVRAHRHDPYLAVSAITAQELAGLGVDPGSITLAYNGLPPVPDFPATDRATEPTLAVLSRLVPHKQIEHAIDLLPALGDRFGTVRLRIMGEGWWRPELEALVAERGLADRVDFLGHVGEAEKFIELSRAWVHLLPSVKEGWGLSIVEAGHVGTPSVCYAGAGGVAEAVLDGVTGLLARDREDLLACTARLLADADLRNELGEKARIRASEFDWDHTARIVGRVLDGAMKTAD